MAITMGYDKVSKLDDDAFARGWQKSIPRVAEGEELGSSLHPWNEESLEPYEINEWFIHVYYDLALGVRRGRGPNGAQCAVICPCSRLTEEQPPAKLAMRVAGLFGLKGDWFPCEISYEGLLHYSIDNALEVAEARLAELQTKEG